MGQHRQGIQQMVGDGLIGITDGGEVVDLVPLQQECGVGEQAFLGDLETYRRLSNLPTLTNYAKDSAGNFYEYGFRMGRPYAVIVVAAGAPEIAGNPYQPAIAYLFPVFSSDIGNTIHYSSPAWSYVKHPDNRATTHEKFYGRLYGGMA